MSLFKVVLLVVGLMILSVVGFFIGAIIGGIIFPFNFLDGRCSSFSIKDFIPGNQDHI